MYLYLWEGEVVRQSQEEPTDGDFDAIDDGTLRVFTPVGGKFVEYQPDGALEDVPEAVVEDDYTTYE